MKSRLCLLLFVFATLQCGAQSSPQYDLCIKNAHTQAELNQCAISEALHVDAELNSVYQNLLLKAKVVQGAQEKIKAAEDAWRLYRDAYIAAMYPVKDKQTEYGSMYPMDVDLLRASLTSEHIKDLRELHKQYEEMAH